MASITSMETLSMSCLVREGRITVQSTLHYTLQNQHKNIYIFSSYQKPSKVSKPISSPSPSPPLPLSAHLLSLSTINTQTGKYTHLPSSIPVQYTTLRGIIISHPSPQTAHPHPSEGHDIISQLLQATSDPPR